LRQSVRTFAPNAAGAATIAVTGTLRSRGFAVGIPSEARKACATVRRHAARSPSPPRSLTLMLHIGILAHSADGAALCFLEMVRESARRLAAHEHPEIPLSVLPMKPALAAYQANDLAAVRAHLARTGQ